MKKKKTKIKIKIIKEPKCQSDSFDKLQVDVAKEEEHGRQSRVKFWIGDFIDNERTPVETRTGVEVKIDNVNGCLEKVCGYVYDSSYRELREWDCNGVYFEDWSKIGDPSLDLFFSSTAKITYDINLRPYTYDELCNLRIRYINRVGVLKKDTKESFIIMHVIDLTNANYTYSVELRNSDEWVTVSEKELLEHYTWLDGKPCGIKRGRN